MVESEELALAELLCARLCHDLAGPIGAVGTGAELIADETLEGGSDGGLAGEALALLTDSAAVAGRRLRFLRLALGCGGGPVGAAQLAELVNGFIGPSGTGGDPIGLDWRDGGTQPWEPDPAKLALNLVLLARDCLPRGGRITVLARQPGAPLLTVTAEGTAATCAGSVAGLTADGPAGLGPRGIQGYYAARLAA
jgi:histidine phosphotransferase ChpT